MSAQAELQRFLGESYRTKVDGVGSEDAVQDDLVSAMKGDSELALAVIWEIDRLTDFIRKRPRQCYISKAQADFLSRAIERMRAG